MKNLVTQVCICLLVMPLMLSCQVNAQRKVYENLGSFTSLEVSSGIDVYLSQGNTNSVEIEADNKSFKDLIVEVDGDALVIKIDRNFMDWFASHGSIKAYVSFRDLKEISLSGGCDLKGQGDLTFKNLRLRASGGSDINMALKANELEAESSGGSDVKLAGYAAKFHGSASGGSDMKAEQLETEDAEVSASGGSDVDIRVNHSLKASASGGSDVYYYGDPEDVDSNESGGSDVTKK